MLKRAFLMFLPAVLVTAIMFVLTHYYRGNGLWYAPFYGFKLQVQAFLRGHLAVADSPFNAPEIDPVWGRGMQLVWGLGVSALQIPFEIFANLCRWKAGFPDKISFLLYYALSASVFWKATALIFRRISEPRATICRALALALVFLSPKLIINISSSFDLHSLVTYYLAIFAALAAGIALIHLESVSKKNTLLIASLCGFLCTVRLTGIFYGLVILALFLFLNRRELSRSTVVLAVLLFAVSPLMILVTNKLRFGSFTEFGYHLMIKDEVDLRFQNPFSSVTYFQAFKELSAVLFADELTTGGHAKAWYAPVHRAREMSTTAFHSYDLILLVIAWSLPAFMRRKFFTDKTRTFLWGFGFFSFLLLFVFYSKASSITTRYVNDFIPALALSVILLLKLGAEKFSPKAMGLFSTLVAAYLAVGWTTDEYIFETGGVTDGSEPVPDQQASADAFRKKITLPEKYACNDFIDPATKRATRPFRSYGIERNMMEWNFDSDCKVGQTTNFFFTAYSCVKVDFDAGPSANAGKILADIAVRSNLEYLRRVSDEARGGHHVVTFCRDPETARKDDNPYQFVTIRWVDASGTPAPDVTLNSITREISGQDIR